VISKDSNHQFKTEAILDMKSKG